MEQEDLPFLQDLYQNAKIGEETLSALSKHVKDENMCNAVARQMEGYSALSSKAKQQIYHYGKAPKEAGPITKTMSQMMSRLNAINNPSPTHIAEMIIQGSTMGIVGATEDLNKYPNADQRVRGLADEIIHFEQENIDHMKGFL